MKLQPIKDYLTGQGKWAIQEPTYQKRTAMPEALMPPPRTEPAEVSIGTALSLAAVYRAVQILEIAVSQLELGVYRNGVEIETPSLILKPDVNTNLNQFLKLTTTSMALTGESFWEIQGKPVASLRVLNPASMEIKVEKGIRTYEYSGYDKPVTFQDDQIKHLKLLDVFGKNRGLGPIQAAKAELGGAVRLRDYAETTFSPDSDLANGVLSTSEYLDSDLRQEYKEAWQQGYGVRVLGNGLAYASTMLSPADVQFLESQQFSISQVARLFGIPAIYMLAQDSASETYTNHESIDIAFIKYTLAGYFTEIEQALTDLTARGQTVRFKIETLLRADQSSRYTAYKTALEAGFLDIDEVRAMEGLPPKTSTFGPNNIKEAITQIA